MSNHCRTFVVMETLKRKNKSKYNFGKLAVGDMLIVRMGDLHSMKVALANYNRRHGENIEFEIDEETSESEAYATRIK